MPSGNPTPRPMDRSWFDGHEVALEFAVTVVVVWTVVVAVIFGPVEPDVRLLMIKASPKANGTKLPLVEFWHSPVVELAGEAQHHSPLVSEALGSRRAKYN